MLAKIESLRAALALAKKLPERVKEHERLSRAAAAITEKNRKQIATLEGEMDAANFQVRAAAAPMNESRVVWKEVVAAIESGTDLLPPSRIPSEIAADLLARKKREEALAAAEARIQRALKARRETGEKLQNLRYEPTNARQAAAVEKAHADACRELVEAEAALKELKG